MLSRTHIINHSDNEDELSSEYFSRKFNLLSKSILYLLSFWVLLVSASLFYNANKRIHYENELANEYARAFFNQIVLTRKWNAEHGGVYVMVTDKTQPNPYLKDEMRDLNINDHTMLTKINPAFMTRQISEIASEHNGIQFHITSLNPLRPDNKATPWEKNALKKFESGISEVGEFVKENGDTSYYYMAPLVTEEACLKCHETQGYKLGDIRGGISIRFKSKNYLDIFSIILTHLFIGTAGFIMLFYLGKKLKEAYITLQSMATLDALTGIPNRRSFTERLLNEYRRCKRDHVPISIIICDIDHFKLYNDTYGHTAGDECLKKVAQKIEIVARRAGDFCARYGGEEFVIILPKTDLNGAQEVAEMLRQGIEDLNIPNKKSKPYGKVTLSLGLACGNPNTMSDKDLIILADTNLYKAKESGRNRVLSSQH